MYYRFIYGHAIIVLTFLFKEISLKYSKRIGKTIHNIFIIARINYTNSSRSKILSFLSLLFFFVKFFKYFQCLTRKWILFLNLHYLITMKWMRIWKFFDVLKFYFFIKIKWFLFFWGKFICVFILFFQINWA
jgi:hypothetical protein